MSAEKRGWMSDVRTLSKQGGTHIITIPLEMVHTMGLHAGEKVLLEQPFMNSIIIRALLQVRETPRGDETRALGWISERERLDRLSDRVPLSTTTADCPCVICRRWRAVVVVRELQLCKWCQTELATVVAFRSAPSQLEMGIL